MSCPPIGGQGACPRRDGRHGRRGRRLTTGNVISRCASWGSYPLTCQPAGRVVAAMKCVVIGAGAWGLPTAAALARRGHDTVLIDRYGVLNAWSSSRGPTRLWRLADPDPIRLRLAMRSVEAMRRLSERANSE